MECFRPILVNAGCVSHYASCGEFGVMLGAIPRCRLFVVKELADTVKEVGFQDSVDEVLPVIADLVDDPGA